MKLPHEILLLIITTLAHSASSIPLRGRSTPFSSLLGLTPLEKTYDNVPTPILHPTKYFYESVFNSHYDGRFGAAELPFDERIWHLRLMLR
jgi:hypothetical protein